jgi:outer membrane protein TolC
MFENTINYRSEYLLDKDGRRQRFRVNRGGAFILKDGSTYQPENGFRLIAADSLIPDDSGDYFRQWRSHIKKADDIWQEIINVSHIPGVTSSPKLQPIEARLIMLSTGMRAPMGLKVSGPDLESIEKGGKALEAALKEVPSVLPSTVFYDRAVGAPYIEIKLNRQKMARYGITVADLQEVINAAVGGMPLTTTVEGRERFPVRLRYPRELRDNPEDLSKLIVPTATGVQIPLKEVADIEYTKGAQMIQSENTFLLGYVIFDKVAGKAEVDVVKEADKVLRRKISSGEVRLPEGVSYKFAGNYEQQERATNRLLIVIPLSLLTILLVLYFRFKTITASFIHFSGVFVAFAGGFILLWLYGEPWFMNFSVGGVNLRDLFQMHPINLSIAVWVGFIALFGIATDDGVLMGSYIHQTFLEKTPQTKDEIREAVVHAGLKRVRPAAMTTATALIALLPVLTSTGKGADIMIPMAIPTFGGMLIQSMTMFVVPVLQCWWREGSIRKKPSKSRSRFSLKCLFILIPLILTGNNLFGQNADSLNHYLEVAAHNNSGVKADFWAYQASLQKLPQVSGYQDPQLEIGFFLKPMEIIEGRQVANIQLMQMFPWFGTKKAARTVAVHMAKMAFEKFRETRDNLYFDVYVQWFTLCRLQQRLINNRKNKELLIRLEELAMRKFSSPISSSGSGSSLPVSTTRSSVPDVGSSGMSGMSVGGSVNSAVSSSGIPSMAMSSDNMSGVSSGMSDILRIQLEMVELDDKIESILSEMEAEKARFNVLLNRPVDSEISVPESFEQIPFLWDAASTIAKIADRNPMLGMINEEELAYKAKAEMDKKMSYPMFGIGLQYTFINKNKSVVVDDMGSSGMNSSSMNGKDMIMPMLSVSVPVYRSKYKAQQKETNFRRQESREKYTNTFRLLEAELYKMKHQLDDASRKSILYKKQLELAQTTYQLMVQEFVSGTSDLTNVIQVQRQFLDYQLKNVEAIVDYNTMAVSIQRLISFKDTE